MRNPLIKAMNKNNPINQMMNFINGGGNFMQIAQNAMQSNPQAQQFMQQAKQMCGSKNPKDFALEIFQKQGGDPDQLLQIAQKMGIE